ncbi:MAG: cytoplasmic protein [Desulfobacterales bacterium]|nr:cytoplasmic protein [Desulfobacterales bacterium]MBS3754669.1 cytoplasmic protein [Desulfobacterales bacterium]
MKKYTHEFVETYDGLLGFGWERETDEQTLVCYMQMFSDDALIKTLVRRMSAEELETLHDMVNSLLRTHLSDTEYHRLFLKEEH